MFANLLFPDPGAFQLLAVDVTADTIAVELQALAPQAACPLCGHLATRVQSRYVRHPRDLAWAGVPVHLRLHVRRFRCPTPSCARQIFTERLPALVRPSARATARLEAAWRQIALVAGGEGGARLCARLGLPTNPDSLLRLVRQAPLPSPPPARVVGVDEWAWRKRHRYGTILVNLETHRVIDLLPDDSRARVTAWFAAHPEIEVISRDRSGPFARAASDGAPQAVQVADRWHLLQNLAEVFKRVLERHTTTLEPLRQRSAPDTAAVSAPPSSSRIEGAEPTDPAEAPSCPASTSAPVGTARAARYAARLARYAEAHRLAELGWSRQAIAHHLHVVPETIRHWLRTDSYPAHPGPKRRGRPLGSRLDPYKAHLRQRVAEGCQNGRLLYSEIVAQGYSGSYSSLRKWLTPVRRAGEAGQPSPVETGGRYSVADLVFALLRRPAERSVEDERLVTALNALAGAVGQAAALTMRFATLIRERQEERLTEWLTDAEASGLAEFATFVHGLRRDEAAVRAALSENWSQGPVEGHNHRLKLIKRAMYGRGHFELLRKRVLLAA